MIGFILALIVAQLADLLTFFCAVSVYGSAVGEANPLAALVYQRFGLTGAAVLKTAATVVMVGLFLTLPNELRPAAIVACLGVPLLGAIVNTTAVMIR